MCPLLSQVVSNVADAIKTSSSPDFDDDDIVC